MSSPFARLSRQNESHNLQICEVINALADSDPDLFDNDTATLMPVKQLPRLGQIDSDHPYCEPLRDATTPVICDKALNAPIDTAKLRLLKGWLTVIARAHADDMARYWRELHAYQLPY